MQRASDLPISFREAQTSLCARAVLYSTSHHILHISPLQHPHPSLWLILTRFQLLRPPRIYLCPISSAPYPSNSPKGNLSTVLTAAKHGKGHLDKDLLDGNSTPDKCTDPKWLLGMQHPGGNLIVRLTQRFRQLKAGALPPHLDISDCDSCLCR